MNAGPPKPPDIPNTEDDEPIIPGKNTAQNTAQDGAKENTPSRIYSTDIDPEFQRLALNQMIAALDGNGVEHDEIHIEKFEGKYLEFIALTTLKLDSKLITKQKAGKVTGGKLVPSAAAFQDEVGKEINKINRSRDVIKRMKDEVLGRKDKGLCVNNEKIRLPFLHKEFVCHEQCKACGAKGKINCVQCHGKGEEPCPKCNARGIDMCNVCGGRQYVQGPNNQQQQCQRCNGSGKIPCMQCHEGKFIKCRKCNASGAMQCTQCNGHAWNSVMCIAEIDTIADYGFERTAIPPEILKILDNLGPKIEEHAQINILERHQDTEKERDDIAIAYHIKVPMADVTFQIKNKNMNALLFGNKARLYYVPTFLMAIMKPGLSALKSAAMGQGDAAKLLKTAGQYKTLRRIIVNTSRAGPKKALKAAERENPLGITDKQIKNCIVMAGRAFNNLNKKPRQIGYGIAIGIGAIFSAIYFLALRLVLTPMLPNANIALACDALIIMAALGIGYFIGNTYSKTALKKSVETLFKK